MPGAGDERQVDTDLESDFDGVDGVALVAIRDSGQAVLGHWIAGVAALAAGVERGGAL